MNVPRTPEQLAVPGSDESIPEIFRCWERVRVVLPPSDPTKPGDPSVNLDTLAAIAHAKWRRAEAAEAQAKELGAALGGLMESMRGVEFTDEQVEVFTTAWMHGHDVLAVSRGTPEAKETE